MTLDQLIEQLQAIRNEIGNGDDIVTDDRDFPILEVGFEPKELEQGNTIWISTNI